jgi:hypothetical protein
MRGPSAVPGRASRRPSSSATRMRTAATGVRPGGGLFSSGAQAERLNSSPCPSFRIPGFITLEPRGAPAPGAPCADVSVRLRFEATLRPAPPSGTMLAAAKRSEPVAAKYSPLPVCWAARPVVTVAHAVAGYLQRGSACAMAGSRRCSPAPGTPSTSGGPPASIRSVSPALSGPEGRARCLSVMATASLHATNEQLVRSAAMVAIGSVTPTAEPVLNPTWS